MARGKATHVFLRGETYWYQRRVPKSVQERPEAWLAHFGGQRTYRATLDTKEYADALQGAAIIERKFENLVRRATSHDQFPVRLAKRVPAARDLGAVAQQVRDGIVRDWRLSIKWAAIDEEAADSLHAKLERAIEEERPAEPGSPASATELELARHFNSEWQFHVDEKSADFAELILAVRDGRAQGRKDANDLLAGKSLPDASSSTLISSFGRKSEPGSTSRRYSETIAEQRRVAGFSPKTIQKANRAQRLFIRLIGDKPIDLIEPQDVHKFIDFVAALTVGKSDRPVTGATVQSYLTQVSSPLAYAVKRRWLLSNPAAGHSIKHWVPASNPVVRPPKRPFSVTELNTIFAYPWFVGCESSDQSHIAGETLLDDMRYWAPVLALYTGARAAELGGLKLSEIVLGAVPHIVIQPNEYRRTKSGKARIVPILDALIDLGFEDYFLRIKKTGSDRLFSDWECPKDFSGSSDDEQTRWANSKWIRSFNRTLIPQILPRQNTKALRSAVTFHSFRGSFKSLLFRSGPEKKANAIIGHIETKMDRAYLEAVTAEDLHSAFSKASYEGLVLPSRRP